MQDVSAISLGAFFLSEEVVRVLGGTWPRCRQEKKTEIAFV